MGFSVSKSEPVNMDIPSPLEDSQTGKSTSPKQTTLELNHEIGSQITCKPLQNENEIVSRKEQKLPVEAGEVLHHYNGAERLELIPEDLTKNSSCEQLQSPIGDATMSSGLVQSVSPPEDATGKSLTLEQTISQPDYEVTSGTVSREELEQKEVNSTENGQYRIAETRIRETDCVGYVESGQPPEDANGNICCEQLNLSPELATMKSSLEQLVSPSENSVVNSNSEPSGPLPDDASENPDSEKLGTPVDEAKNPRRLGRGGKRTNAGKGKSALKSSLDCTRVLRSKEKSKAPKPGSQEKSKTPELMNFSAEIVAIEEKRRKKRKKKCETIPVSEFSKIRNHLRYLITRISYEKNLIDAYSGEGWKGQSLEKVKLEKELERAKAEISRRKLKIRDLFQSLDLSCAEGKLPESLFDSEGEIDSEDIFCAKCGSKDLPADNDIILCDGACERGFHQLCLVPPLLKEDIPPDDEGWLCPGCDCKVDCISILNESLGTNFCITDSWEKVFPEAAAGNKLDDNFGFPSDDSEDDDYDPNGPEDDEKVQEDKTSSEESDFISASDDFRASPNNEQYLGLPSDDSEDDDYNPDAPDLDEKIKQEVSSSDFTSESEDSTSEPEDFGNRTSAEDEGHMSLESDPGLGDSVLVSGKRHVERLDYKRLHDETYGNVSSDSSDEEFLDTNVKKNNIGRPVSVSPTEKIQATRKRTNAKDASRGRKEHDHIPKRRARKKLDVGGTNTSPAKLCKSSSEPGSSGKSNPKSAHKKLGEAVSQGLFQSFKENQYPKRDTKENLASELGITLQQVNKWFENARWSFRHSSRTESSTAKGGPNKGTTSSQANGADNKEPVGPNASKKDCSDGDVPARNLVANESRSQKSTTPKSRKRKGKLDQAIGHSPSTEVTPNQSAQVDSSEAIKSGRAQKSRRKSVT